MRWCAPSAAVGCSSCTPTTPRTRSARSATGTRRSARGASARTRSWSCSATRGPVVCRWSSRPPGTPPRTAATSSCSAPCGMPETRRATLALVGVTAIWGSTFVVVKDAVERMPVTDFLTWRFALAALAMLALRPRSVAALGAAGRRAGLLLGVALGSGYLLQTLGLQHTSAAVSGFITGMFVVLTPLGAAVLLRQAPSRLAWLAVSVATVGLALLSLRGLSVGSGELLT